MAEAESTEPTLDSPILDSDRPQLLSLPDIPPLTTQPVFNHDDQVTALHLIADSVAQQRQLASRALISHPVNLAAVAVVMAITIKLVMVRGGIGGDGAGAGAGAGDADADAEAVGSGDWMLIGTTCVGVLMAALVGVRFVTGPYLLLAEQTGTWKWLDRGLTGGEGGEDDEERDTVIGCFWGEQMIGALVLRFVGAGSEKTALASREKTKKTNNKKKKKEKEEEEEENHDEEEKVIGMIRAWTVKRRYRGKGIGTALLEEAVREARETPGCEGVQFADDHANSKRVLWKLYNGSFDEWDRKGREALEKVWTEAVELEESRRNRRYVLGH